MPKAPEIFELEQESQWDQLVDKCILPVVVEFFTPWCEPCKEYEEVLEKINKEKLQVLFYRYNLDRLHYQADRHSIIGVPTLLLLLPRKTPDGEVQTIDTIRGFLPYDILKPKIDKLIERWQKGQPDAIPGEPEEVSGEPGSGVPAEPSGSSLSGDDIPF